jgi:hypothetical protein
MMARLILVDDHTGGVGSLNLPLWNKYRTVPIFCNLFAYYLCTNEWCE